MATNYYGTSGNDTINKSGTNVEWNIWAGAGNDTVFGGNLDDTIQGEDGNDTLYGGGGSDWLSGGNGADKLYGEAGNDYLYGESGADRLYGGDGNDFLNGGADNDYLYGGAGNDTLFGDSGTDYLYGGAGNDILYGGAGGDYFVFELNGGTDDRIKDFVDGTDKIGIAAGVTTVGWAAYDLNGDGTAESTLLAFGNSTSYSTYAIVENVLATSFDNSDFVIV